MDVLLDGAKVMARVIRCRCSTPRGAKLRLGQRLFDMKSSDLRLLGVGIKKPSLRLSIIECRVDSFLI